MHLLNALPQRLDPGATPTFAGLISASLTSPASTNLTLGTGTSGAAITVLSASNNVGIGTTTPNSQLDVYKASTGGKLRLSSNTNATYGELIFSSNDPSYLTYGSSIEGTGDSNGLNVGDLIFKTGYGEVRTERMKINRSGVVTLANTTAGSSGAGALVVQGGLSTGAASYFGGQVTTHGAGSTNYGTANSTLYLSRATASYGNFVLFQGRTAYDTYIGTIGTAAGIATTNDDLVIGQKGNAPTFAITPSTGAATFAGTVTVTGALKLGNAYVAGAVVGTGSITIQDSTGTTYRIPVLV